MQLELITFEVAGQVFGIDIMAIREIRAWTPVTRLPQVPHYVAGVVNLRGTVLPVLDLAARLGWERTEASARHAIIVAQINGKATGLIVDSVSDIVGLDEKALQPPPTSGNDPIVGFIQGVAPIEDRMAMILDLQSLAHDQTASEAA